MAEITPDQVKQFRYSYNCLLNESRHQYGRAITRPIGPVDPGEYLDHPVVQVEPGLDVTLQREHFHQLVADAEVGRQQRETWNRHPAVKQAYHEYLMLLALTRQDYEDRNL